MVEILQSLKDLLPPFILELLLRSIFSFVVALAIVYIFGRMLNLVNSDRGRNSIALIIILGWSAFEEYIIHDFDIEEIVMFIYNTIIYSSISILLYVWLGFKAFSRIDNWLDKRVAPDDEK